MNVFAACISRLHKTVDAEGSQRKVILAYAVFLIANIIYLNMFAMNIGQDSEYFFYPLNMDQRKSYIPTIRQMEENWSDVNLLNNTAGISYAYYLLKKMIGFPYDAIPLVSFLVNNTCIILCYRYFVRIGTQLGFMMRYRWMFFLNPALIYYSQLINKEIFSLLFVLAFTWHLGQKQPWKLLIASGLSSFIRMQLAPVGVLSLWLYRRHRCIAGIVMLYVITSLVSGISISDVTLDESQLLREDGSSGLAKLMYLLNQEYYVGSLLLNPIRVIQYLYDQLLSLCVIAEDGRITMYYLRDVPFLMVMACLLGPLVVLVLRIRKYLHTPARALITVTCVYMIVLLMHFIVHARYLFPISYNMILLSLYVAHGRYREEAVADNGAGKVRVAEADTTA